MKQYWAPGLEKISIDKGHNSDVVLRTHGRRYDGVIVIDHFFQCANRQRAASKFINFEVLGLSSGMHRKFVSNHWTIEASHTCLKLSLGRSFTSFCSSLGRWISWFWMNSCSMSKKSLTRSNFSNLNLHFDVGNIWGILTAAAGPFFFFLFVTFAGAAFFFSFFSSSGLSPISKLFQEIISKMSLWSEVGYGVEYCRWWKVRRSSSWVVVGISSQNPESFERVSVFLKLNGNSIRENEPLFRAAAADSSRWASARSRCYEVITADAAVHEAWSKDAYVVTLSVIER